ncbi:hypothetical protein R1flu_009424 [Riccia fluitans]|uniref:Uncharacterized protein n=1 Tax=Riccia fluitans TaxID=41844 RepID=A0ABD1Z678_9MARC
MSRASYSPLRSRDAMEVVAIMEFVKRKALHCWESALGVKWRTHTWTLSASKRLHPWIRNPTVLVTDAVAWILLVEVGLSLILLSLAWVYFYGMVLFAPYLTVLFWLLSYFVPPIWNLSHPPASLTAGFAACSIMMFSILSFIQRRTKTRDPSLELGDFMTSFLSGVPSVQQLVVGYTIFSLGSACAAVLTLDVLLSVYWGFFGAIYSLEICCLVFCRFPWYISLPMGLTFSGLSVGLFWKYKIARQPAVESERQIFQLGGFRTPTKSPV